ncbi:hypothetical protein [Microbacterium rhizosphaerae]|uniref:PilN domain-containing protein n=1 Tax=Microbacterium rhizosphaerae TaxID=1678237 RepID=A0ABZ0SP69_9MICO|nr:hypothetical protein [Microbacterium rhizosphaerae]WPR91152.1 hypothetical protein SM116_07665 [Microbacterium rhizosphaerae]
MARRLEPAYAGVPRVNLMPRSETDRREREALGRKWMWGVLGAILVACMIIAAAFGLTWVANERLAAEQAQTNQLVTELVGLSDVSGALASQRELTQFRAQAMGSDFAWAPVIGAVTSALPGGTTLTGFDVTSGGNPVTGSDPKTAVGLVGTFTVNSATPLDMASTVRAVRGASGVMAADGMAVTASNVVVGQYQYELSVTFNQTIYSGQYDTKVAK